MFINLGKSFNPSNMDRADIVHVQRIVDFQSLPLESQYIIRYYLSAKPNVPFSTETHVILEMEEGSTETPTQEYIESQMYYTNGFGSMLAVLDFSPGWYCSHHHTNGDWDDVKAREGVWECSKIYFRATAFSEQYVTDSGFRQMLDRMYNFIKYGEHPW